jgi:hypothetical protein
VEARDAALAALTAAKSRSEKAVSESNWKRVVFVGVFVYTFFGGFAGGYCKVFEASSRSSVTVEAAAAAAIASSTTTRGAAA